MSAADTIVNVLLEADEFDPEAEVNRYSETFDFDRGAGDILRDARELFQRLNADHTIQTLQKEQETYGSGGGFDESAVAQAIIRRAIERRDSLGANKVYRRLKTLNPYNF